jgi:peptidoglycan hydrolase-like protein with peptidoglycan-binding domain
MARSRVARLAAPAAPAADTSGGGGGAPDSPTVSLAALKGEVGTMATERTLKLDQRARQIIQQRLKVMEFDPGNTAGNFNEKTRKAIAEWQKKNDVKETGLLGPVQRTAIMEQSEAAWQRYVAALPMTPTSTRALGPNPGPRQAARPAPPPRVSPGVAAAQQQRRAAQQVPRDVPVRQQVVRPNPMGGVGAFIGGMAVGGAIGGLLRR